MKWMKINKKQKQPNCGIVKIIMYRIYKVSMNSFGKIFAIIKKCIVIFSNVHINILELIFISLKNREVILGNWNVDKLHDSITLMFHIHYIVIFWFSYVHRYIIELTLFCVKKKERKKLLWSFKPKVLVNRAELGVFQGTDSPWSVLQVQLATYSFLILLISVLER